MSSAKWRPFCLGLNVLIYEYISHESSLRYLLKLAAGLCYPHILELLHWHNDNRTIVPGPVKQL